MFTIEEQFQRNINQDPLDLRELQTTGGALLHEMMHCRVITNPHFHRMFFTVQISGVQLTRIVRDMVTLEGRRIYELEECHNATIRTVLGLDVTIQNADSFAQTGSGT
jgi:hypothetical protein